MGQFEGYANWMGGVYENDFAKVDGEWKIARDQVFNTYFAVYDQGWKDITRRAPPGITDSNPPDLPPSLPFEMFPSAFLPPYHDPNPVTGADRWYPYPVLDPQNPALSPQGYAGVSLYVVGIALVIGAVACGVVAVGRVRAGSGRAARHT